MKERYHISDGLFDAIYKAITEEFNWVVFTSNVVFLQKEDLHFFRTPGEARVFADRQGPTTHTVRFAASVPSLYRQLEGHTPTKQISSLKFENMNQKNLDYLKDNLKYMGFGDKLNEQLEKELTKGAPNFQLTLESEINSKAFAAVLNFRKSDTTDMYFFNSYHATLGRKDGESVDQAFYLRDGKGVTAKEAFNLLDGRAVHKELTNKEGVEYKAWVQIDFDKRDKNNNHEMKQFHENYGYDLKSAVGKFPVAEMDGGEKEKALLQSLMKGNVQSVNVEVNGESKKMFIEAAPQFKTVNLYDDKMQRLGKDQQMALAGGEKGLGTDVSAKKVNGKGVESGTEKEQGVRPTPGEESSKKKDKKVGDLLPKKEEKGSKKGLRVG